MNKLIDHERWRGGWDHIKEKMKSGIHPEPGAQRLNNLLSKDDCFRKLFTIPEVLAATHNIIKNDISLSSLILRAPQAYTGAQKTSYRLVPRKKDSEPYRSVICSILLDDVSKASGATRFVPESHKLLGLPDDYGYTVVSQSIQMKIFYGS